MPHQTQKSKEQNRVRGKPGVALMGCRWVSQNIDLTHGITQNLHMNTFESEKSSYTGKKSH